MRAHAFCRIARDATARNAIVPEAQSLHQPARPRDVGGARNPPASTACTSGWCAAVVHAVEAVGSEQRGEREWLTASLRAADYRSLVRLIDQLYAGALDPAEWPKFLTSVARMFDAQNAFICQLRGRREPIQYISLSQRKRDVLPVARYSTRGVRPTL